MSKFESRNGQYSWTFEDGSYFKKEIIPRLLFDRNNHICAVLDHKNIMNGDDLWVAVGNMAMKVQYNARVQLDMVIVGCKSIVTIDVSKHSVIVAPYNTQGYERKMIEFMNFIDKD